MAEAPATGKKFLGLKGKDWAYVGGAGVLLFFGYRWLASRSSSSAGGGAATALQGGSSIPTAVTLPGTTTTAPTTFTSWVKRALTLVTKPGYTNAAAYSDIENWLNGNCVTSAGYSAISTILGSLGGPPGGGHPGVVRVCTTNSGSTTTGTSGSGSTTTHTTAPPPPPPPPPSNTPPSNPGLTAAAANLGAIPGQQIVSSAWDAATKTWLFLSNDGGVFAEAPTGHPGGVFYGSYLGLPPQDRQGVRSFVQIIANPTGSYTAISTHGERYTFNPTTAKLPGGG